ncbi:MAG: hypothetical protein LBB10_03395 [Bifidobacteriaceae bacterium]|jgi:hypothetical protein|nr:hypothetical protein [Bifidobacteriaceae bacterium]
MKKRIIFTVIGSLIIGILSVITVLSTPDKHYTAYAAETPTGAGRWFDWTPHGYPGVQTWLGAFDLGSGRKGYCIEVGLAAGSPGEYPASSGWYMEDKTLGYLVGAYTNNNDNLTQAGLAVAIHRLADRGQYWPIINANLPSDIARKADELLNEANDKALNPNSVTNSSTEYTAAKRLGTITAPKTQNYYNNSSPRRFTATISGPAVFKSNNSKTLTTSNDGTVNKKLPWKATGKGDVNIKFDFAYEPTQVWRSEVQGLQPMIEIPDYTQNHINKQATFFANKKVNPTLISTTHIEGSGAFSNIDSAHSPFNTDLPFDISREDGGIYIQKGQIAKDNITIVAKEGSWIRDDNNNAIPVTLIGTLYGPYESSKGFSTAPSESDKNKIAATVKETITPPESTNLANNIVINKSGIYTWNWKINIADQDPEYQKYFESSFDDGFFKNNEVLVYQMTPQFKTLTSNRTAFIGAKFHDSLSVSLPENDIWTENEPLKFDGTLLGPYNRPEAYSQNRDINNEPQVYKQSLIFTSSATKPTDDVSILEPGFYTWNWFMDASQSPKLEQTNLNDGVFAEKETISILSEISHYSKMQEYNVNSGGRAFDTVEISGMPDDHPEFAGLEGTSWRADEKNANYKVYYYGQTPPKSKNVPDGASVLFEKALPAKNGVYTIGKTDADAIIPKNCGYYGAVYSFSGDDRVRAYQSPANDIDEQFYIDCKTNTIQFFEKTGPQLQTGATAFANNIFSKLFYAVPFYYGKNII